MAVNWPGRLMVDNYPWQMLENCYKSGVFKMYMLVDLCKTPPSFTFSLPLRAEMGKGNVWKLISFLSAWCTESLKKGLS